MAKGGNTAFRLTDLPPELILEIALYAQTLWWEEAFTSSAHAPYAGVKRYMVRQPPPPTGASSCCNGMDWQCNRPRCLKLCDPLSSRSPAHRLSQTCRAMRDILIDGNAALWTRDNTLFKAIAERSGIESYTVDPAKMATRRGSKVIAAQISYGSTSLIALNACSCLTSKRWRHQSSLQYVKLACPMPHGDSAYGAAEFADFLIGFSHKDSPLRHFDLEVYNALPFQPKTPQFIATSLEAPGLLVSRFSGSHIFFYSSTLTSLYLYHSLACDVRFEESFWEALKACGDALEYLTIDSGGDASFQIQDPVALPNLRFLHLVLTQFAGQDFLRSVNLPATLDLHLELVVDWRKTLRLVIPTSAPFTVPWPAVEELEQAEGLAPLSRYALALAACDQTAVIFPPGHVAQTSQNEVWSRMTAVGLDVRIDPSTLATEPAAARMPEFVGLAFAGSSEQLLALLTDPVGRNWRRSEPPPDKHTARRSLAIRDPEFTARRRQLDRNHSLPKILYDVVNYTASTFVDGTTIAGCSYRSLIFARDSWLPDRSLGWHDFLTPFSSITCIGIACPLLPHGVQLQQNMEGCLALAHLEALGLFLNTPRGRDERLRTLLWPCGALRRIWIPVTATELRLSQLPERSQLDLLFNSPERTSSGVPHVLIDFSSFPT